MSELLPVVLLLVAAAAPGITSESAGPGDPSEVQIPATSTARFPDVSEPEGPAAELATPVSLSIYRYGSGLEADAPVGAPDILLCSRLEDGSLTQAATEKAVVLRFGSGLEGDAPAGPPNILLCLGLEDGSLAQAALAKAAVLQFGSGLESDAPARAPNVLLESGLGDDAPALPSNALYHPGF